MRRADPVLKVSAPGRRPVGPISSCRCSGVARPRAGSASVHCRAVAFQGWPTEAIDFYDGLEEDNSKAYWHAHKESYESSVRAPMDELLTELAPEFGEGRVFRPNRDTRFSADKSPYKTSIAATLAGGGYVQLSAAGLGVGNGLYRPASDQLERYRQAIDA